MKSIRRSIDSIFYLLVCSIRFRMFMMHEPMTFPPACRMPNYLTNQWPKLGLEVFVSKNSETEPFPFKTTLFTILMRTRSQSYQFFIFSSWFVYSSLQISFRSSWLGLAFIWCSKPRNLCLKFDQIKVLPFQPDQMLNGRVWLNVIRYAPAIPLKMQQN